MNYLAHAYLSFGDGLILTGNMIGDNVKGQKALAELPERIAEGVRLHRKIDAFTDEHAAVQRAKVWFREPYHLYAGAILDSLWDHFLANDPACFGSEEVLKDFAQVTYAQLADTADWHPPQFAQYFAYMREHNWLYNYRTLAGIRRSLKGLERRAQHMPPIDEAYNIFIGRYYQLAQCYYELVDAVKVFVKAELAR
jgi:acyl carrier protein phosphodiesterase